VTPQPTLRVAVPRGHAPWVINSGGRPVTAVALVLHGGRSKSVQPVTRRQLTVLRMRPFASALRKAGADDGLAVARLRYAVRGWNGDMQSPLADARWALDQLAERFPGVPVAIVGHSMGGRTALYVADHDNVRAVVALAPWIEPGDPVAQLAGRRVLLAHGTHDRMTSAANSEAYAERAAGIASSVSYVSVAEEAHSMMKRAAIWHDLACGYALGVLYDKSPEETVRPDTTNVVTQALAGRRALVV
jgi:dienelactone hydrolase